MIKGIAVSPGIIHGTAYVLAGDSHILVPRREIAETEIKTELNRFDAALKEAEDELVSLQKAVREKIGKEEAKIFDAQLLVLKDPAFLKEVSLLTLTKKTNIEAALADVIERFSRMFSQIEDPYLRERASDFRDVGRRVLNILMKHQQGETFTFPGGVIVVAHELLPSVTAHMELQKVRGFVTEEGGKTSHTSILARSIGIPAVIGIKEATLKIKTNDFLIVDGLAGTVLVNPKKAFIEEYQKLEADFEAHKNTLKDLIDLPTITQDGTPIKLQANIGKLADAQAAFLFKAKGIGLYRTEFSFLIRDQFPTEEEQFQIYRDVGERFQTTEVAVRVLDLGSDKVLPYFPVPAEKNPSLGKRGTRLLLSHPDIFKTQLRAILRVSAEFPVHILLPMINGVEEMMDARKIFEAVKAELLEEGTKFNPKIKLGAMIETPSAVIMAEKIAQVADFLSVGTNDLIQYVLTADRASQNMSSYYEPFHPAVLCILYDLVQKAKKNGKEISICGEMAGDPACTQLLLGFGVRSLSVAPGEILEVKKMIRASKIKDCEIMAKRVLELSTADEIKNTLKKADKMTPLKVFPNGEPAGK